MVAVAYGINLATQQSTNLVQIGSCPEHLTFTPNGTQVWIPNSEARQIAVLNPATNTLLTPISLPGGPSQISFTQDGSTAYVAEGSDHSCADTSATGIAQVNVSSQQITGNIPVGLLPKGSWSTKHLPAKPAGSASPYRKCPEESGHGRLRVCATKARKQRVKPA